MAKLRTGEKLSEQQESHPYERWAPNTAKEIPLEDLETYPGNFELVGRLEPEQKAALKEDILKEGLREPLEVVFRGDRLLVVSGNERLEILKELPKPPATVTCIKKEFESDSAINRHIWAVNKHRKQVRIPLPEVLEKLFPEEEYPLLYKDLRGNYSYESPDRPGSESEKNPIRFTPEEARERRQKERKERKKQIEKIAEITGARESSIEKSLQQGTKSKAPKKAAKKKAGSKKKKSASGHGVQLGAKEIREGLKALDLGALTKKERETLKETLEQTLAKLQK